MQVLNPYYLVSPSRLKPYSLANTKRSCISKINANKMTRFTNKKQSFQQLSINQAQKIKLVMPDDNNKMLMIKQNQQRIRSALNSKEMSNITSLNNTFSNYAQIGHQQVQHLRNTMIHQYHRNRHFRYKHKKSSNIVSQHIYQFDRQYSLKNHYFNKSGIAQVNKHNSHNAINFTSLNCFYKKIIIKRFQNRQKQGFELQVSQITIGNRFKGYDLSNKLHFKEKHGPKINEMSEYRDFKSEKKQRKQPKIGIKMNQKNNIMPWNTINEDES